MKREGGEGKEAANGHEDIGGNGNDERQRERHLLFTLIISSKFENIYIGIPSSERDVDIYTCLSLSLSRNPLLRLLLLPLLCLLLRLRSLGNCKLSSYSPASLSLPLSFCLPLGGATSGRISLFWYTKLIRCWHRASTHASTSFSQPKPGFSSPSPATSAPSSRPRAVPFCWQSVKAKSPSVVQVRDLSPSPSTLATCKRHFISKVYLNSSCVCVWVWVCLASLVIPCIID